MSSRGRSLDICILCVAKSLFPSFVPLETPQYLYMKQWSGKTLKQNKNISKNLTTNLSAFLGKPKKERFLFFVLLLVQFTAEDQVTPGSLFFLVGLLVELEFHTYVKRSHMPFGVIYSTRNF